MAASGTPPSTIKNLKLVLPRVPLSRTCDSLGETRFNITKPKLTRARGPVVKRLKT